MHTHIAEKGRYDWWMSLTVAVENELIDDKCVFVHTSPALLYLVQQLSVKLIHSFLVSERFKVLV